MATEDKTAAKEQQAPNDCGDAKQVVNEELKNSKPVVGCWNVSIQNTRELAATLNKLADDMTARSGGGGEVAYTERLNEDLKGYLVVMEKVCGELIEKIDRMREIIEVLQPAEELKPDPLTHKDERAIKWLNRMLKEMGEREITFVKSMPTPNEDWDAKIMRKRKDMDDLLALEREIFERYRRWEKVQQDAKEARKETARALLKKLPELLKDFI